jgi:hypothetical protein
VIDTSPSNVGDFLIHGSTVKWQTHSDDPSKRSSQPVPVRQHLWMKKKVARSLWKDFSPTRRLRDAWSSPDLRFLT